MLYLNTKYQAMDNLGIKNIYTIGEIVYDIMFKNGQPVAAKPGGSMLNSSISLGRSGLPVSFTGTCGNDEVGRLVSGFLAENGVNTGFLFLEDSQTIIALAFLDEKNNATYSFYRGERPPAQPPLPEPGANDVVLFGSFYSLTEPTRNFTLSLRNAARDSGALIIYDPNFRQSHIGEVGRLRPLIEDHILHAGIVRGSDEDFENIFGTTSAESTWDLSCFRNCSALVYTRSADGVDLCTRGFSRHYPVPGIKPVSTIGAGDSFNAGMIVALYENNICSRDIARCTPGQWDMIIEKGISFSTLVCMSYDNYIPAT
jgi:fructokinase